MSNMIQKSSYKSYEEIAYLFQTNTEGYLDYIQPFKQYEEMIYTAVCWGIINKPLPSSPKEIKNIIGDSRRWVYIFRLCGYLWQQEINDTTHQLTEKNKSYRLLSIDNPLKNSFKGIWQITFDPTLRTIKLSTNIKYGIIEEDNTMNRLRMTYLQARQITAIFINHFKSITPSDVIKHWSHSFAVDVSDVYDRNTYLVHKKQQPWRKDFIL